MFGIGSEAPPISSFVHGYLCDDLSFRQTLIDLLISCSLSILSAAQMADLLVIVGGKYKLCGYSYKEADTSISIQISGNTNFGHMLQILVHKSLVDHISYISLPYEVPINGATPPSMFLRSNDGINGDVLHAIDQFKNNSINTGICHGQSRIITHPSNLTDASKCITHHFPKSTWNMKIQRCLLRAAGYV